MNAGRVKHRRKENHEDNVAGETLRDPDGTKEEEKKTHTPSSVYF